MRQLPLVGALEYFKFLTLVTILATTLTACAIALPSEAGERLPAVTATRILLTAPATATYAATAIALPTQSTAADVPILTATAVVYRDCGWSRTIIVWLDQNSDGIQDSDEPPLTGVTATARYATDADPFDEGMTDSSGQVILASGIISCASPPEIITMVIAPTGYRPVKPTVLSSKNTVAWDYRIGFVPTAP